MELHRLPIRRNAIALESKSKNDKPTNCMTMAKLTEQNFNDYKNAERKALEILAAMKATTPKKVDIELALLVSLFELHKGEVPAETIAKIVQGHLDTLVPFYRSKSADN